MYPHHVFDLEPAGTFEMYPICYWQVSGRYFQPEPAMYSRCFRWFPGPLTPSGRCFNCQETGHKQQNCPKLSLMKPPKQSIKAGAVQYMKLEKLAD